jgi:hypothetical protein
MHPTATWLDMNQSMQRLGLILLFGRGKNDLYLITPLSSLHWMQPYTSADYKGLIHISALDASLRIFCFLSRCAFFCFHYLAEWPTQFGWLELILLCIVIFHVFLSYCKFTMWLNLPSLVLAAH